MPKYRLHLISFEYKNLGAYCVAYGDGRNLTQEYLEVIEEWLAEAKKKIIPEPETSNIEDLF